MALFSYLHAIASFQSVHDWNKTLFIASFQSVHELEVKFFPLFSIQKINDRDCQSFPFFWKVCKKITKIKKIGKPCYLIGVFTDEV